MPGCWKVYPRGAYGRPKAETVILEEIKMAIETTVLPLKTAYAFGSEHSLQAEVDEIKDMEIGWNLSYTSTVRRGYIVDLFEKRGLLEEFKAKHWAYGNT